MSSHDLHQSLSSMSQENTKQDFSHRFQSPESSTSLDTVRHTCNRDLSSRSISSLRSHISRPLRVTNANVCPSRTSSACTSHYPESSKNSISLRKVSKWECHRSSWGNDIPVPPQFRKSSALFLESGPLEDVDLDTEDTTNNLHQHKARNFKCDNAQNLIAERTQVETSLTNQPGAGLVRKKVLVKPSILVADTAAHKRHPFNKWMNTLRRRSSKRRGTLKLRQERWSLDDLGEGDFARSPAVGDEKENGHRKSSSWSSFGFVGVVRSATISLKSLSMPPQTQNPKRSLLLSNKNRTSNRSSWMFNAGHRGSIDSSQGSAQVIDEAAWERALQRRRTLEELISSEESYISDLKVLVYLTLIVSSSNVNLRTPLEIQRNITEILDLHEEILLQVRRVLPDSELRSDYEGAYCSRKPKHTRCNSLESSEAINRTGSTHIARRSLEANTSKRPKRGVLISDPREGAEIAKIFGRLMGRFFIYEEYGAKYEATLLDLSSASKAIPNWGIYERGIEALANSLASTSSRAIYSKKGLAFEDLLIKPIQRVCKYPLLFADLFKHTPVIDGPDSRMEVEKVLCRLKEMVKEINKATNDQKTRDRMQRSWYLQDLLNFPDSPTAPASLRLLGHATLCGVLYVAYQSKTSVHGEYMLCALFKSYLLLAVPKPRTTKYNVVAIMGLSDVQIDKSNNTRGLQCYTAPYSWKLTFESDQQLYELIFCACSAREEEQWKSSLLEHSIKEDQMQREDHMTLPAVFFILALDIKSLGHVFGLPGTLTRRISIQRAATVSSRSHTCQVIITDTNCLRDYASKENLASKSVMRSQSLLVGSRVITLAPIRADRQRMEHSLADVWTRDLLPYPGMSPHRGEHLIRSSASMMMRKLSRAGKSNSLNKRSTSSTTVPDNRTNAISNDNGPAVELDQHELSTHYSQSYRRSLSRIEDESIRTLPSVDSPVQRSSAKGLNILRRRGTGSSHPISEQKDMVKRDESSYKSSAQGVSSKRSNPKMLLKTLSSDAIRSWFT